MTVTILAKPDVSRKDDNDNETCCRDKDCDQHTGKLLKESCDEKKETEKSDMIGKKTCHEEDKKILSFKEAPEYMKHNTFILSGYRGNLNTLSCMESIFWWTNETINIWSHIFGFVLFIAASIRDVVSLDVYAHFSDKFIVGFVLICFQVCMFLSAAYHTFCCRSARDCDRFLSYDLFGIALSLLAIYTSGIYYAFWCEPGLLYFYLFTVTIIFAMAMLLHIPSLKVDSNVKMLVFIAWAAYGIVPTLHWATHMGWFDSPLVTLLLPKVVVMYLISGVAFIVYISKIPERFYSGKFDYLGHSHQWWHLLIVAALYHWHNSGMVYLEYRFNHACASQTTFI